MAISAQVDTEYIPNPPLYSDWDQNTLRTYIPYNHNRIHWREQYQNGLVVAQSFKNLRSELTGFGVYVFKYTYAGGPNENLYFGITDQLPSNPFTHEYIVLGEITPTDWENTEGDEPKTYAWFEIDPSVELVPEQEYFLIGFSRNEPISQSWLWAYRGNMYDRGGYYYWQSEQTGWMNDAYDQLDSLFWTWTKTGEPPPPEHEIPLWALVVGVVATFGLVSLLD